LAYDTDQQPVTPVAVPPVTNFAFGAPSGRRRTTNWRFVVPAAVVAVIGAQFGMKVIDGLDDSAKPAPKPPAAVARTTDPKVVFETLKNLAVAEEAYGLDGAGYTTKMASLVEQGFRPDRRVTVRVISATAKRFCASGTGAGKLVLYYDSAHGGMSRTPCH
jgi:hypothetical protein